MRVPIAIQIEPFDIETIQPQIDATRDMFLRYLENVPRQSTRSKHGLMGPVGKILREVRSGRRDPASLKGYALRVHEGLHVNPSLTAINTLGNGIDQLVSMLGHVPLADQDRVLDRIDYGLYYDLRRKAIESKEARRRMWIGFVRDRYRTEADLSASWNESISNFDELYLPRKNEGSKGKKASAKQQDIAEFWEAQGAAIIIALEEEE